MKILIIEPVSDLGGVSQYILSILRNLRRKDADLLFAASGNGPLFGKLEKENIRTVSLPIDYNAFEFFKSVRAVRDFLEKEGIDIVHAHTTKAGLLAAIASSRTRAHFVFTGHGWRFLQRGFPAGIIFRVIAQFICRKAERVGVLSESEQGEGMGIGIPSQKFFIAPMSIDAEKYGFNSEDRENIRSRLGIGESPLIGIVASIVKEKDPDFFADVCSDVSKRIPEARFIWIGGGPLAEILKKKISGYGLSEKVTITGYVDSDEIPKFLSALDIFFLSSNIEVFPISLLEAMALGRYCVAPDVGSISFILEKGNCGALYETGNLRQASDAIVNGLKEPVKEAGSRARERVLREFSPAERLANIHARIYDAIIKR